MWVFLVANTVSQEGSKMIAGLVGWLCEGPKLQRRDTLPIQATKTDTS